MLISEFSFTVFSSNCNFQITIFIESPLCNLHSILTHILIVTNFSAVTVFYLFTELFCYNFTDSDKRVKELHNKNL